MYTITSVVSTCKWMGFKGVLYIRPFKGYRARLPAPLLILVVEFLGISIHQNEKFECIDVTVESLKICQLADDNYFVEDTNLRMSLRL